MPILRRLLLLLTVLVVVGIFALGWYVSVRGFTRPWRTYVVSEFRKAGLEISLRKLTLDPFRGLVAKGVKILDARDRRRTIAVIDEMLLGISYANALQGKSALESLDLRDAYLWLPINPGDPDGPKIEITQLTARLFLPPQQLYLAQAEAEIAGVRITGAGRLIHPEAFQRATEGDKSLADRVERVLEEIKALKRSGAQPQLSFQIQGDLAEPRSVRLDIRGRAEKLRKKGCDLRKVELACTLREGALELNQLRIEDEHGELHASGSYNPATGAYSARLRGDADLQELNRTFRFWPELSERLAHYAFNKPPSLEVSVEGEIGSAKPPLIVGRFAAGRFAYKTPFESLDFHFSSAGAAWSIRELRLTHRTGEIRADMVSLPNDFHARFEGTIDPRAISLWCDPRLAGFFSRFDFYEPPSFGIDVRGRSTALELISGGGEISFGKTGYRGASSPGAISALECAGGQFALMPFVLLRDGATVEMRLVLDLKQNEARFENF